MTINFDGIVVLTDPLYVPSKLFDNIENEKLDSEVHDFMHLFMFPLLKKNGTNYGTKN